MKMTLVAYQTYIVHGETVAIAAEDPSIKEAFQRRLHTSVVCIPRPTNMEYHCVGKSTCLGTTSMGQADA